MTRTFASDKPIVLVASCQRELGLSTAAATGLDYIAAVRLAGARPLLVPAGDPAEILSLLDLADGVFLTGSPSNVHPSHFDHEIHDPSLPLDSARDAWSLPLIREAIGWGVPLFAICRGFQEFNVALGGSLHQAVHEVPGLMDHRPASEEILDEKFGPAHPVDLAPGGLLETWLGETRVIVNSVHGQGIAHLAPRLRAEAFAPDGLVEAFTDPDAPAFNLGVQWHPEWHAAENPVSRCLLEKFGNACRLRHQR